MNGGLGAVEVLTPSRAAEATEILARAFMHDPAAVRLFPVERQRTAALRRRFGPRVLDAIERGEAFGIGRPLAAVALWERGAGRSLRATLREVAAEISLLRYPVAVLRAARIAPALREMQRRAGADRCRVLSALGVDPARQREGLGRSLVHHLASRCDREGLACYLETSNPFTLDFYARAGFRGVAETPAGEGVTIFALTRPAG